MNRGMSIRGISWCLPERFETNEDLVREFGTWTPEKIYKKTGIVKRHIADIDKPVSHYLALAGEKFFAEHPEVSRDSIDMLVVCCEARDYIAPATACVVHHKLGLRKSCGAVDYELGCSGYVYGLSVAKGYIAAGIADRVLLMRGGEIALDGTPEELFRSGLLDEVFGIRARKIDDETFVFTKKEDSE